MNRRFACVLIPLTLFIPAIDAAAQVLPMSPGELGSAADAVVLGTVESTRSFWNADRTKIYTEIVVTAEQAFKGTPGAAIRVLQLGGTVDNVKVTVHGALAWAAGEEVLLFLESYRQGRHVVTGLSQGKFAVSRDPLSGERYVSRPVPDASGHRSAGADPWPDPLDGVPRASLASRSSARAGLSG